MAPRRGIPQEKKSNYLHGSCSAVESSLRSVEEYQRTDVVQFGHL